MNNNHFAYLQCPSDLFDLVFCNDDNEDVLEIPKESKDSFYVSPCCKISITQSSSNTRSASLKTKKKVLPPLSKENKSISKQKSLDYYRSSSQDLKRLHSPTSGNNKESQFKKIDLNQTFSHQSSTSSETNILLPLTDNKKKSPSKVKNIEASLSVKTNGNNILTGFDTPITIDILSESGRYSRQSLEPLSTNRYSSRPTSLREPLFRKPSLSGRLKSVKTDLNENIQNMDRISINQIVNETNYNNITQVDDDYMNNQENLIDQQLSDFELEDDLNESQQNNSQINDLIVSSFSNVQNAQNSNQDLKNLEMNNTFNESNNKLDTIKESSINELMQVNIKKLHLNDKQNKEFKDYQITQPTSSSNSKPNNSNTNKPPSIKKQIVKKTDSKTKLNPPPPAPRKNISTNSSSKLNISNQSSSNTTTVKSSNTATKIDRSRSIDSKQNEKHNVSTISNKSQLNLDLFTPAPVQNDSPKQTTIINSDVNKGNTGILKKKSTNSIINKSNSSNKLLVKEQIPAITRIDSSRIELNKKQNSNPKQINVKLEEKKNSSASIATDISNLTTVTALTNQSENENNNRTFSSIYKKSDSSILNDMKLEINSSRVNLAEKQSSNVALSPHHKNHQQEAAISEEMNRLLSAANKLNKIPDPSVFMERNYSNNNLNVDKPTQPFIVTLFEDFPQPFTSKSINYISSANLQTKKVKMSKKPKNNNYKQRLSSGSKTTTKSKQKTQGDSSSKANNNKSKSNKSKIKLKKNEIETPPVETETNSPNSEDLNNNNIEKIDEKLLNQIDKNDYETDDFEAESADSSISDDDDDENHGDNDEKFNFVDEDSDDKNLKKSTSENDLYLKSLGESTSEEVIIKKTNNQNKDKLELKEDGPSAITKLNKDMIQSFEDRVFAIYNKFDILLSQQEIILDKNGSEKSSEITQKLNELNEQKAQFSQEMARELSENVNFDQITSNPELVRRLKNLYKLVKTNGIQSDEEPESNKKPPLPEFSKNSINKNPQSKNEDSNNLNRLFKTRKQSVSFGSVKSNADIREVYSMINSMNGNSKNDNENLESTVKSNKTNSIFSNKTLNSKIYQLPENLSHKINDLMVPIKINEDENNKNDDEDSNELTIKPGAEIRESFEEINFDLDQITKLKINYSNGLDSVGNELNNEYDPNSISYHYDVKYRNDGSKSPISLQIEGSYDFQFRWKRGNLIGKGAFGSVYQAMLSTGVIIAVKQIEMEDGMDPTRARKEYDNVREEVKILRELDHINIVQFMGTMLEGNIVNIFMELIPGGTIETLLKIYGPFEESLFKNFTQQILEGVNYIHSRNVVHRDIKGRNIMLMGNGIIKLIDFGCAKRLKKNQSSNSIKQLLKSLKGTPYWMSPEVIRETGHGPKADIWSVGATIFEMATGLPPYSELAPISAIYAIGSGEAPPPVLPSKFSQEAIDFVTKCLTRSPDLRPSAQELLIHDFLTK